MKARWVPSLRSLARYARDVVGHATGAYLFRVLPHGFDAAADIRRLFPVYEPGVVLDIGANVGQTLIRLRRSFPRSRILCFEPVAETFERLASRAAGLSNVECHRLAFGDQPGQVSMRISEQSVTNRIVDGDGADAVERVEMLRLDDFCRVRGIDRVGYMKVDTEGYDMRVVAGARGLIDHGTVDFIQLEAGLNSASEYHVPFEKMLPEMRAMGYVLFGIYSQAQRWPNGLALRRVDAVFVARRLCPNL